MNEFGNEDARREAFLRQTIDAIKAEGLVGSEHYERLAGYLRTVWLEAREEEHGEDVFLDGSEFWEDTLDVS